jgi:hypothetical protein
MSISIKRPNWTLLLPIVFGIAAFFLVVGMDPLIPTNIAWLSGQDPSQHYLGWAFFRYSPWTNPIGFNPQFGLEIANSIAFSDAIPWIAFILKPFSDVLSEPFQYTGLWVLLCFILQAWFSWKLAGLITQDLVLRLLICGLLGVFAPPFLKRLGLHAALMGQFLILAALYLNLLPKSNPARQFTFTLSWLALVTLSALTNFYLLVMIFSLWFACVCDSLLTRQYTFKKIAVNILAINGAIALCLWQAGYFIHSGTPIQAEGFGQYKLNVLSLFDAGRFSYFLKAIPHPEDLEEGFAFLGAGLLALLVLLIISVSRSVLPKKTPLEKNLNSTMAINNASVVFGPALWACLICFTVFALSNQVSIGLWTWTYPLPESILQLASILRSSARFFWPVYYVLAFLILCWVVKYFPRKKALVILAIALAIQIIDTSAGWLPLRKTFAQLSQAQTPPVLSGPFWDAAGKRYQKVVIWPLRSGQTQEHWQALSYFASQHQMGTNAVYLGRRADPVKVAQSNQAVLAQLENGQLSPDTLYVISNTSTHQQWLNQQEFSKDTCVVKINGLIAIGPHWPNCALTAISTNQ